MHVTWPLAPALHNARLPATSRVCVVATLLISWLPPATVEAGVGYGYKRAEDPLVLGVKRIILNARKGQWKAAREELGRLDWQFEEFRKDLRIDIADKVEAALDSESIPDLSRAVSRLMYFAIVQKFHWNRVERCQKYVPAKSRVEAARFYYEEILSIGARDHDRKHDGELHPAILDDFKRLRSSVGTPGLFGLGARPPDLETFQRRSESILRALRKVYPHVTRDVKRLEKKPNTATEADDGEREEGAS